MQIIGARDGQGRAGVVVIIITMRDDDIEPVGSTTQKHADQWGGSLRDIFGFLSSLRVSSV